MSTPALQVPQSSGRAVPNPKIYPHIIQNGQGLWLKWTEWWPRSCAATEIKGCLFLVSGLGEHAMRYDGFAEEIAEELHLAVFSLDHQGHGLSEGPRKYVDKFEYYITDYLQFLLTVFAKYCGVGGVDLSEKPRFLLGHSMGGLIALHVAKACANGAIPESHRAILSSSSLSYSSSSTVQQYGSVETTAAADGDQKSTSSPLPSLTSKLLTEKNQLFFNGVVYSGPAIKPDPNVATPTKQTLARWLANWAPMMGLGNLDIQEICSNPQVVEYSKNDFLFPKEPLRARWGYEMLLAMGEVQSNPNAFLNFPFLIIHGEKDTLTQPEASEEFFRKATEVQDKKYVLYKGKKHEILNEIGCEEVRRDVKDFILAHIGCKPKNTAVVCVGSPEPTSAQK